eukprot:COSAG01_NODE_328_length_18729_cov_163.186571_6_plen_84_part_00
MINPAEPGSSGAAAVRSCVVRPCVADSAARTAQRRPGALPTYRAPRYLVILPIGIMQTTPTLPGRADHSDPIEPIEIPRTRRY